MINRGITAVCIGTLVGCGPSIVVQGDDTASAIDDAGDNESSGGMASGGGVGTSSDPVPDPDPSTDGDTIGALDTGEGTGGDTDDGGVSFITGNDAGPCASLPPGTLGHCTLRCDIFAQDCPAGEKCMPWANDGGSSWNATRCSPIAEDPAGIGEACEVEGSGVSGLDNCEATAMCFNVDPETNEGTCVAMCQGSYEDPQCSPDASCSIGAEGTLAVCIPHCDPLAADCGENQVCVPTSGDDAFSCLPGVADPLADGEACEFLNLCQSGSMCLSADAVGCDSEVGCCTPFCNVLVGEPNPACANPEHECLPWFEQGNPPPQLDNVGVCGIPG